MKKIAVVFLTSVFSLSLALPAFAGSSTLSLEVDSSSYSTADAVPVVVNVNPNGASLDTVRIELSFDPSYLHADMYVLGDLFTYPSPAYEIDNTNGVMSFGGYKFGDVVTQSGAVATVYFTAVAEGETSVTVSSDTKLISDGEEQFDSRELDTLTISLSGETVEEVVEEPSYSDASLEAQALVYFGAFYARMPSNATDWEALHCIAYGGCQGDPRDVNAEAAALELFGQKYAKMPETSMEWNVLHTIAYTDLLTYDTQTEATTEEIAEEESSSTTSEMSVEEQAIGWFGTLAGYLPTSDADWLAIDYMVNGYFPEVRDLDGEVSAISRFTQAFGYEPSSHEDWNVVSAIAYSGAF